MRRFGRLVIALIGFAFIAAGPAYALSLSGTHAWSTDTLVLRDGPGTQYHVTGELGAELHIKVLRCEELWCLVDGDGGRGWTYKHSISFGLTPAKWPRHVSNEPTGNRSVCFYQGTNYTGDSFCVRRGRVINDLALLGLDNAFSSVRVEGSASVSVCRDRDFQSYCERIYASQPVLDRYLRRALSAIRAH